MIGISEFMAVFRPLSDNNHLHNSENNQNIINSYGIITNSGKIFLSTNENNLAFLGSICI